MRVVADARTTHVLRAYGQLFVWPRSRRCCAGQQHVLEAAVERPANKEFELVYRCDGFEVHATPGLSEPDELHLELDRRQRVRAFWNGQGWIG